MVEDEQHVGLYVPSQVLGKHTLSLSFGIIFNLIVYILGGNENRKAFPKVRWWLSLTFCLSGPPPIPPRREGAERPWQIEKKFEGSFEEQQSRERGNMVKQAVPSPHDR